MAQTPEGVGTSTTALHFDKMAYAVERFGHIDDELKPHGARLDLSRDEMGSGVDLRMRTPTRTVRPGAVAVLADHGLGIEFIAEEDGAVTWQVHALDDGR